MSTDRRTDPSGARALRRVLRALALCLGALCASAETAPAQPRGAPVATARAQLDAALTAHKNALCKEPGSEPCIQFTRFMDGSIPKLPPGKVFAIGRIVEGTRVLPGRFDTFLSENTDQLRLATTVTKADNPAEEQDCLRYIESLRAGKPYTSSAVHQFWRVQFDHQEKYVPKIQDGYLMYAPRGAGPVLLRQNGKVLYAFAIALRPRLPGSFDTVPVPAFSYFYLP